MNRKSLSYDYRFLPEIISRDREDLLAQRGITVSI